MLTQKEHILNRKHAIERAWGTQAAFAKHLGVSYVGLHKTITCQTRNHIMHDYVARAMGTTKEDFFPDIYAAAVIPINKSISEQAANVN